MSESTSYQASGKETSEVRYDEEGRPYVVVKKKVRVRRRKQREPELEPSLVDTAGRSSVASHHIGRPLPPIPQEYTSHPYHGGATRARVRTSHNSRPPPVAGYSPPHFEPSESESRTATGVRVPDPPQQWSAHSQRVPTASHGHYEPESPAPYFQEERIAQPPPPRPAEATPITDRSGPYFSVVEAAPQPHRRAHEADPAPALAPAVAAAPAAVRTYVKPNQQPNDNLTSVNTTDSSQSHQDNFKSVYVHRQRKDSRLSAQEEFKRARLRYYSKIKWSELNNRQKIEFLKIKHSRAGNEWVKGGPAIEIVEPPHDLDNFCYRLPRPKLGSPKHSVVKDNLFEPVDPPDSALRDLPEPVISWQPGTTRYNAAYTSITTRGNTLLQPDKESLDRPQMSRHDIPDPNFEKTNVLYSNANPTDFEDDFLPVLPPNAMTSRDGDFVFVNPPPEGAPKSSKISHDNHVTAAESNSMRPASINENTSQENADVSSSSVHGIWDQLKDFEVSDLPRHERQPTNTIVVGYEVLHVKNSSGSSSHGSFKKSGFMTPPNSRASPVKPPRDIAPVLRPHHKKYIGGISTPPHIIKARQEAADEIVDEVLIGANNQFNIEMQRNSMGGYL